MSSWTRRLNIIRMSPLSQINRFNFCKTDVTIKIYMEVQRVKKNKVEKTCFIDYKDLL